MSVKARAVDMAHLNEMQPLVINDPEPHRQLTVPKLLLASWMFTCATRPVVMLWTDSGSMWPVPSWTGTNSGPPRRSLCWRKLSGEEPRKEETSPGAPTFSIRTQSPPSGPTGTWSKNTLAPHTLVSLFSLAARSVQRELSCRVRRRKRWQ